MEAHWTERSIEDYRFRIVADFISQIEEKMKVQETSRDELSKILDKTKGRISQMLNNPGNITFDNIVKLARALKMKVSLVAYEDDDPANKNGPINSEVFKICWEKMGKPQNLWAIQEITGDKLIASTNGWRLLPPNTRMMRGSIDKTAVSDFKGGNEICLR